MLIKTFFFLHNLSFILVKNIFLFPSRLYFIFFTKKKKILHKKDYLKFNASNFSKDLDSYIKSNYDDIIKKKISFYKKNKKNLFFFHINDLIDKSYYNKIYQFFSSNKIENTISNYFGFSVKLKKIYLRINFHNPNCSEEEGSKMWHRDNDSLFGQFKLFMIVNNLLGGKFGGIFYFIPQSSIAGSVKIKTNYSKKDGLVADDINCRVRENDINKFKSAIKIVEFGKKQGEILVLDTNDAYHKGGYIKNNKGYRIMINAFYHPTFFDFSIVNDKYFSNFVYRVCTKILIGIKNRIRLPV
jgi:hypothetical protein